VRHTGPPTTKQYRLLFGLAKRAGESSEAVRDLVRYSYGYESLKQLESGEYEETLNFYQELVGERSRSAGHAGPGRLTDHMAILRCLQEEGLPWNPLIATEADVTLAAQVLDDFRRSRTAFAWVTQAQVRRWLSWWGRHPLHVWRGAVEKWLSGYRAQGEVKFQELLRSYKRAAKARDALRAL